MRVKQIMPNSKDKRNSKQGSPPIDKYPQIGELYLKESSYHYKLDSTGKSTAHSDPSSVHRHQQTQPSDDGDDASLSSGSLKHIVDYILPSDNTSCDASHDYRDIKITSDKQYSCPRKSTMSQKNAGSKYVNHKKPIRPCFDCNRPVICDGRCDPPTCDDVKNPIPVRYNVVQVPSCGDRFQPQSGCQKILKPVTPLSVYRDPHIAYDDINQPKVYPNGIQPPVCEDNNQPPMSSNEAQPVNDKRNRPSNLVNNDNQSQAFVSKGNPLAPYFHQTISVERENPLVFNKNVLQTIRDGEGKIQISNFDKMEFDEDSEDMEDTSINSGPKPYQTSSGIHIFEKKRAIFHNQLPLKNKDKKCHELQSDPEGPSSRFPPKEDLKCNSYTQTDQQRAKGMQKGKRSGRTCKTCEFAANDTMNNNQAAEPKQVNKSELPSPTCGEQPRTPLNEQKPCEDDNSILKSIQNSMEKESVKENSKRSSACRRFYQIENIVSEGQPDDSTVKATFRLKETSRPEGSPEGDLGETVEFYRLHKKDSGQLKLCAICQLVCPTWSNVCDKCGKKILLSDRVGKDNPSRQQMPYFILYPVSKDEDFPAEFLANWRLKESFTN